MKDGHRSVSAPRQNFRSAMTSSSFITSEAVLSNLFSVPGLPLGVNIAPVYQCAGCRWLPLNPSLVSCLDFAASVRSSSTNVWLTRMISCHSVSVYSETWLGLNTRIDTMVASEAGELE